MDGDGLCALHVRGAAARTEPAAVRRAIAATGLPRALFSALWAGGAAVEVAVPCASARRLLAALRPVLSESGLCALAAEEATVGPEEARLLCDAASAVLAGARDSALCACLAARIARLQSLMPIGEGAVEAQADAAPETAGPAPRAPEDVFAVYGLAGDGAQPDVSALLASRGLPRPSAVVLGVSCAEVCLPADTDVACALSQNDGQTPGTAGPLWIQRAPLPGHVADAELRVLADGRAAGASAAMRRRQDALSAECRRRGLAL